MGSIFNPGDDSVGWIGNGAVLISTLDKYDRPKGGFEDVGYCSSASLSLSTESAEVQDTKYGTNAVAMSKVIKLGADVAITIKSFQRSNIARSLYGDVAKEVATSKTITRTVNLGKSVNLDGIATEITSVKSSDGLKTYESGVHYKESSGTIFFYDIQPEEDAIAEDDEVEIQYMSAAIERIEGFIKKSLNVMIVFEGRNEGTPGREEDVKVTWYKVALEPAAQRQLISTDYADLELKGKLQISKAVTGTGLSKMFKEEFAPDSVEE